MSANLQVFSVSHLIFIEQTKIVNSPIFLIATSIFANATSIFALLAPGMRRKLELYEKEIRDCSKII